MLNPWMLLGLAGLSVPIIIHLIQRQRLKPQQLATLHFLDEEDIANAFAPLPRDPLQLVLRLILLGLFVLLMSRLVTSGSDVGPRTLAVVLDQSMSMQRKVGETRTLYDQAKQQVLELIDGLRPDDRMSLALVGDRVTTETGYLQDKAELRKIAEGFEVSDSGALALGPAIQTAVNQLRSRREVNACVLVFSDHQRLNYASYLPTEDTKTSGSEPIESALQAALDGSGVKLLLIDERPAAGKNLTIETARFSPEQVYIGASSRVTAVVRNDTKEAQTATVTVAEGDVTGQQRAISLQPGEAAHVDLVQRFESPIDSACRVEIEEDMLPGDNRFHLPMRVKDRRQVLLVTSAATESDEERGLDLGYRGTDLLAYALNPGEMLGLGSGTNINVKRVTPQLLQRTSLPVYSLIVLYGVTELSEQSTKDLTAFVAAGGGLWLIPDREMSPLRFNDAFGPLLHGFAIGQMKQPETTQSLGRDEARLTHPLLLPLVREDWGAVREIYFSEYFGVETPGQSAVALRTTDGDPLGMIVRHERGQVFVQLFSCDLEASSLARSTAFVPLVQQVSASLGERGEMVRPDMMRVGEVLRMRLPEFRNLKGDIVAAGPESKKFAITGAEVDEIRVEGLRKAGAYEVSHSARDGGRKRWLTVNPVAGESNLTTLTEEDQTQVFGAAAVRVPYQHVATQFSNRHEIAAWLIVLVIVALIVEALFGAWQSRQGARKARGEAAV